MLGLNDRHITRREITGRRLPWQRVPGHAKGDGDYVLSRRPDDIILGPAHGTTISRPWFLTDLELAETPEFLQLYRERRVRIDVRDTEEYERVAQVQSGALILTYCERICSPFSPARLRSGGE